MSNFEDIEEGCGCIWGIISGVMVVGGLIFALSNDSPSSSNSYSKPKQQYSSPNTAPIISTPYYTPSYPVIERRASRSFTPDDAYDEGYAQGYEQGRNDGLQGLRHGASYDDSNDYYNHYETMYCVGYEVGYNEGYSEGESEYEENEDEYDY